MLAAELIFVTITTATIPLLVTAYLGYPFSEGTWPLRNPRLLLPLEILASNVVGFTIYDFTALDKSKNTLISACKRTGYTLTGLDYLTSVRQILSNTFQFLSPAIHQKSSYACYHTFDSAKATEGKTAIPEVVFQGAQPLTP